MNALLDCLANHRFKELFLDVLGWEHASGSHTFSAEGRQFSISVLAHKRGLQIFHCSADRQTLINRKRLRAVQQRVIRLAHEHILIYSSEGPPRQVWQWAIRKPDGGRLRHREHPFLSHSPPAALLARLEGLRFRLDEEQAVNLMEALDRVRRALDAEAELKLFVRSPLYAEQSDLLFEAMRAGGIRERNEFLLFHRPMADWVAKRFHRQYQHDEDDAQQICWLGLIRAASLFDPLRGFQFSTYAIHSMRRTMQRRWEEEFNIRLPVHVWPHYFAMRRQLNDLAVSGGPAAINEFLVRLEQWEPEAAARWYAVQQVLGMERLAEVNAEKIQELKSRRDNVESPLEQLVWADWERVLWHSLARLPELDAKALYLKLGFDGKPRTLDDVGQIMGVTRERVRQRIERAIERLRDLLREELESDFGVPVPVNPPRCPPGRPPGKPNREPSLAGAAPAPQS
jgi:RNA polymerase primary sigma factor